jgi:mannobiose 2-epimerase
MEKELAQYKREVEKELQDILQYWMKRTVDHVNGGFVGKIDHGEIPHPEAPKGSVLNSRILWSFSAAYNLTKKKDYLPFAQRAFRYLLNHFLDKDYGGVYWTVDYKGAPLDTKKQIYALSFAIYGLGEYYLATSDEEAKAAAVQIYQDIVAHSHDDEHGGYIEALARDWKELGDLRLSAKDANERKSMNTHLHVLEGFANLYRIWPDEGLKEKIKELIRLFLNHIISAETNHLILFFDDEWNPKSNIISYGHDIEAAWLVQEAAEVIGDETLLQEVKDRSLLVANAAVEGLDSDGGLWYEYDVDEQHLIKQKHWWPQAESMVGFFNAWQIGGDKNHLQQSLRSWNFVRQFILDKKSGEWMWGVHEDYSPLTDEDKVGLWKCPYHNSRACIEIIRRITTLPVVVSGVENETNANN